MNLKKLKKNKLIKIVYYKICYTFFLILSCFEFKRKNLAFMRRALSYGVHHKFFKNSIRDLIFSKYLSENDTFLLVGILNSLGLVYCGNHILKRKSKLDIESNKRIFTRDCLSAFGHIALLDIFIKAKILKYQNFAEDYIESNPNPNPNYVINRFFSGYFKEMKFSKNFGNMFIENYNYTYLNNNFILLDEFNSKVQADFERKYNVKTVTNYYYNNLSSVNRSSWHVCLHVRDSKDFMTNLRSASIYSYHLAIKLILSNGGGVYRILDNGIINRYLIRNGNLIETFYSNNIEMQFEIISNCRFFIGTGSGPINIASHVMGRPILATNWAPLGCRLSWGDQVILPKKFIRADSDMVLSYSKRLNGGFSRIESNLRLNELGYLCIDNSENEIKLATSEMLEATQSGKFNGNHFYKTILQKKFYKIITNNNRLMPIYIPDNYAQYHQNEIL